VRDSRDPSLDVETGVPLPMADPSSSILGHPRASEFDRAFESSMDRAFQHLGELEDALYRIQKLRDELSDDEHHPNSSS